MKSIVRTLSASLLAAVWLTIVAIPTSAAPAPKTPAQKPVKLPRPAGPGEELWGELQPLDDKHRHGSPEKFLQLEARADELAKQFPKRDDLASIWFRVAHIAAQSGVDKQAERVRRYATKCLEISRDPCDRMTLYSYLASTVSLSGHAVANGRREAAEYLLVGYAEMLAQELPDVAPEIPGTKIGGFIPVGGKEEADLRAEEAARNEAIFVRDQIFRRTILEMQLRDLYRPDPKYNGRNEDGPDELRKLAGFRMTESQVGAMMKKVLEGK